jgi:ABC-type uncharacterized transport system substrate-binding protein
VRRRLAAMLLSALALLSTFDRAGDSWGQTKIARVGILSSVIGGSTDATVQFYESFRRTLAQHGWIERKNVSFEYRSARGDPPQFADPAAELVRLEVDVIYTENAPATRAAYTATRTIPIVAIDFTNDPVAAGYAQSYSRPGGNLTGLFLDAPEFAGKWLEPLKAMVPDLSRVAVLWDPSPGATHLQAVQAAAPSFGVRLEVLEVRTSDDLDRAFSRFHGRPQALIILPSPLTYSQSARLAKLAIKHRLPATSLTPAFAEAGGVIAYGPEQASSVERVAVLVAKVLSGAKPADLPVERPAKINLIVNLKTAKALGLTLPDSVLLRADRVIR